MTDSVRVDEEEQRLRERLKAKSQKRRASEQEGKQPDFRDKDTDVRRSERGRSPSPRHNHNHHDQHRREDDYRGGGGRDRYAPYDHWGRRAPPFRDDYRRRGNNYHNRSPPSQQQHHHPPARDAYGRDPYGREPYYGGPNRGGGGGRRGHYEDRYVGREGGGRGPSPPPRRNRRRSRSDSRSLSRSRSRSSRDDGYSSRSGSRDGRRRPSRRSRSRSRSISPSVSGSDSESSRSSVASSPEPKGEEGTDMAFSKDQRTVFVTQLVQRTVERDIKKYFSKQNLKVNEVILLRDKRTGRHKGCAYVELRRMEDVPKAVGLSNVAPTFQRFPILIKASEAEKNNVAGPSTSALTASQMGQKISSSPLLGTNGKLLEAQKVYVGSLDPSVTQEHLFVLFRQFGQLEKVSLQVDSASGISKGFAFLSFRDPKEANLAIQTMGNQVLAGRPMKTGWAVNQIASIPGAEVVTSEEFPEDSSVRATNAYKVLGQLTMGIPVSQIGQMGPTPPTSLAMPAASTSRVPTVAEARVNLASMGQPVVATEASGGSMHQQNSHDAEDPTKVGNADKPTNHILVRNMFDKDQETEEGWEKEIKEEFEEECTKFGKILGLKVMSKEIGGKIYASFDSTQGAQSCASSLAGRWFDKRRLQVEFVQAGDIPSSD